MYKKVFKSGDIITPEFLNELQNISFEKSPDEVGGLPVFVILVEKEDRISLVMLHAYYKIGYRLDIPSIVSQMCT